MKLLVLILFSFLAYSPLLEASGINAEFIFRDKDGKGLDDVVVFMTPASVPAQRALSVRNVKKQAMIQYRRTYYPYVLPIPKGGKVIFPNLDSTKHHVFSFDEKTTLELPTIAGDQKRTDPITYPEPGDFIIGCRLHDKMIGHIYVVDTPLVTRTIGGKAWIKDIPPGAYTIEAWHPDRINGPKRWTLENRFQAEINMENIQFDYIAEVDWSKRPALIQTAQAEFESKLPRSMQLPIPKARFSGKQKPKSRQAPKISAAELDFVIGNSKQKKPQTKKSELAEVIGETKPSNKSTEPPKKSNVDQSELEAIIGQ